jgi:hypothetical protein
MPFLILLISLVHWYRRTIGEEAEAPARLRVLPLAVVVPAIPTASIATDAGPRHVTRVSAPTARARGIGVVDVADYREFDKFKAPIKRGNCHRGAAIVEAPGKESRRQLLGGAGTGFPAPPQCLHKLGRFRGSRGEPRGVDEDVETGSHQQFDRKSACSRRLLKPC